MMKQNQAKREQNNTENFDVQINELINNSTYQLTVFFPNLLDSAYNVTSAMIETKMTRNYTVYLSIMILFILILVYSYAAYLWKIPVKMKNKVLMTIRLLSIIPPRIIADIPSIRNTLNNSSI